jgi:hypothetical protein
MNDDPTWGPNNSPTFPVFFWTVVHEKKHGTMAKLGELK